MRSHENSRSACTDFDPNNTYAPVACYYRIRLLWVISAATNLILEREDNFKRNLRGTDDITIYMELQSGSSGKVANKDIYDDWKVSI